MSKILFTGATGLVGSRVFELFDGKQEFIPISWKERDGFITADLTVFEDLNKKLANIDFEYIFHFAGFTAVDDAESQRGDKNGACYKLNVDATANLVKIAKNKNARLIYISSDFVFEGDSGPYNENSPTGQMEKLSWYGWTKKLGEESVLGSDNNQVIRIAYPFRSSFEKGDFARDIIARMENKTLYPLFNDQYLTPTFIDNLSDFLKTSISQDLKGVFHIASTDTVTPFSFGQIINEVFGFNYSIAEGSIKKFQSDFPNKAKRPQNGGLKLTKLESIPFVPLSNLKAIKILKTQIASQSAKIS